MNLQTARDQLCSDEADTIIQGLDFLARQGSLSDLAQIMRLIDQEDIAVRKTAITTAASIIKHNLLNRFNEISPEMRIKLGTILTSLDPKVIDEISQDLFSKDEQRRLLAVQILGLLRKHPSVRKMMATLVKDRDVKIRATAINLLGKMIGPNDQELVLALLNDPDKRVRANTVEALESLGNRRMVPILLRLRMDPNNRTRGNVLKALYNLGHKDIEADIVTMLSLKDPLMKASALWVVSQIDLNSKKIEDAAAEHLLSFNDMINDNAKKTLVSLKTPRAKGYLNYLDNALNK